jgi:hypothetical protein
LIFGNGFKRIPSSYFIVDVDFQLITLQGKYSLVEVFADAPIKISQKSIYRE